MAPIYTYTKNFRLSQDDIKGIQELYGKLQLGGLRVGIGGSRVACDGGPVVGTRKVPSIQDCRRQRQEAGVLRLSGGVRATLQGKPLSFLVNATVHTPLSSLEPLCGRRGRNRLSTF